ncbi:MAG: substrate-binding domain-containing protein, partial [Tepidisphaeraceae bacterium]
RLPLRSELQQKFKVSTATVQGALNRLIQDGFVQAQGRLGTYVTPNPPHLCHYALVFPKPPSATQIRSRFWTALSNEAAVFAQQGARKFPLYYGIDEHVDNEVYQRLLADVRGQRVAGLVFAFVESDELEGNPLLDSAHGVPRVRVTSDAHHRDMPGVVLDMRSFIDRALDHLQSKRRKRVALMMVSGTRQEHLDYFNAGVEKRRMTTKPYWVQSVGWPETHWANNVVRLLTHDDQKTRPDALIVFDDNIVEPVTAGLVAEGVRVPDDVEVVAHSNFPWSPARVVPVRYLGFDARRVLQAAVDNIDRQRRGDRVPPVTMLNSVFEDELNGAARG